ncbi:MAG: hypothetical protein IJJ13_05370 [Lachnospiraceae bacterium]|nr:hypothetical protein [Lachnospiraceae bacterium]
MTGMDLLDAMEHVDPELIEAAEHPPVKKKKVTPFVWTGAAAAACVAVIAGVSFMVVQSRSLGSAAATAEMAAEGAKREAADTAENAAEIHTPAQVIAQLNQELQELAADETGFQSIELVMLEGKPVINVTITKDQAALYDTDQTASDAFDGVLTALAGQISKRLHDDSFMGGPEGYVYIDGQTEPYRFFDEEHAWNTLE